MNGMVVIDPDDIMTINRECFVKLAKQLRSTCRLLGFKTDGRPLSKTMIIEKLIELREREFRKYCKGFCENSLFDGVEDEKVPKRGYQPRHDMPAVATIDAPSMPAAGIDGIQLQVRLAKTPSLWVRLTSEVIAYVSAVARHEHDGGAVKRKHPSSNVSIDDREHAKSSVKGVSYHFSGARAGSYRAVRTIESATKKMKETKYFSVTSAGGETMTELKEKAEKFVRQSSDIMHVKLID